MFSEKINLQPLSATDRIKNLLTIAGVNPTDKTVAEIIGNEDKKNNASTINNVTPSNSANVDCITTNYNTGAGNIQSATQEFSENITPNIEGTPITDSDKGTPADDKPSISYTDFKTFESWVEKYTNDQKDFYHKLKHELEQFLKCTIADDVLTVFLESDKPFDGFKRFLANFDIRIIHDSGEVWAIYADEEQVFVDELKIVQRTIADHKINNTPADPQIDDNSGGVGNKPLTDDELKSLKELFETGYNTKQDAALAICLLDNVLGGKFEMPMPKDRKRITDLKFYKPFFNLNYDKDIVTFTREGAEKFCADTFKQIINSASTPMLNLYFSSTCKNDEKHKPAHRILGERFLREMDRRADNLFGYGIVEGGDLSNVPCGFSFFDKYLQSIQSHSGISITAKNGVDKIYFIGVVWYVKPLDPADVSKFNLSPIVDEGKKAIITTEPLNTDTKIAIAAQNTSEHNGDNSDKKADSPNNTLEEIINRILKPAISNDELNAIKFASKDERRKLHNAIIQLDIRTKGYPLDRRDGIICPHCENGSGRDGTGAILKLKTNKHGVEYVDYFCGKCQEVKGNLINVIMAVNNLSDREGYLKALAIGQKILDADICKIDLSTIQQGTDAEISQEEKELIRKDIANAQTCDIPEIYRRGISADTFKKFHCGFIGQWWHTKWRLNKNHIPPTPRIIIPTGAENYVAVLPKQLRVEDVSKLPSHKKTYHCGHKNNFFNADTLSAGVNVVVEGEFDALSILQVSTNINVCALGGTAYKTLIALLNDNFQSRVDRFNLSFVILLDNDDAGRKAAPLLRDELLKMGCPATCKFLDEGTDKVDANDILRKEGDAALKAKIEEIMTTAQIELANAKEKILSTPKVDDDNAAHHAGNKNIPDNLKISADLRKKLFGGDNSDADNAERILLLNGDKIRYDQKLKKWLTYDGEVWSIGDADNENIFPFAGQTLRILKANVRHGNEKENKIVRAFKTTSRINAAISHIKTNTDRNISIKQEELNAHPYYLNCKNGVVDLRTGELIPRDPKFYLTQICNAEYRAGYHNPIVDKFFCDILPDEETRNALIRYLGYCLTGHSNAEKTLFLRGAGGNGKGTLTATLLKLFGDYGVAFPIRALLVQRNENDAESATPTLATLLYARLAVCEEIPQNKRLDAAKFKTYTGRDEIPYRNLHEKQSYIKQITHSFIVSGNYDIELTDAGDEGLKRRWLQIPFNQDFTKNPDTNLKDKLVTPDALSGLLTVLVDAAIGFYKDGKKLLESKAMEDAKEEFFGDQNFIETFINECCYFDRQATIPLKDFVARLKGYVPEDKYFTDKALRDMTRRTLTKNHNVEIIKPKNRITLSGVGLMNTNA